MEGGYYRFEAYSMTNAPYRHSLCLDPHKGQDDLGLFRCYHGVYDTTPSDMRPGHSHNGKAKAELKRNESTQCSGGLLDPFGDAYSVLSIDIGSGCKLAVTWFPDGI